MTTLVTIAILVLAVWGVLRLPAVRAWREERRRKAAEESYRRTAEALKESGVTREQIRASLRESGGMEGMAPYFGLTPKEIADCRRARSQYKAEMERKFRSLGKVLESYRKKEGEN